MTKKEQLKQEAKKSCIDKTHYCIGGYGGKAYCEGYIDSAEPREKRIADLEAQIKHLTKHLEPQSMTALFEQVEEEVKREQRIEKLDKAKKIIKTFLGFADAFGYSPSIDKFITEAEQFLNSEVSE